jgi:hypothetical protein
VRDQPIGEISENLLVAGEIFYFNGRFCTLWKKCFKDIQDEITFELELIIDCDNR